MPTFYIESGTGRKLTDPSQITAGNFAIESVTGQRIEAPTTPVVPTPTAPAPTAGEIYKQPFAQPEYNPELATALAERTARAKETGMGVVDEAKIKSDILAQFQAEIDAQNTLYAEKLKVAQLAGRGRLGEEGAIQARRGLLGSDFGTAQTETVRQANIDIENQIAAEKAAAISNIMSTVKRDTAARIAEKTAAKEAGLESWIKYLGEEGTRKETEANKAAQLLLSQGYKLEDLTPDELTKLTQGYGVSSDAIKNAYITLQKAKTEADKVKADADRKVKLEETKTQAEIDKINKEITKGTYREIDLGNRVLIWDDINQKEITSYAKGLAPKAPDQKSIDEMKTQQDVLVPDLKDKVAQIDTLINHAGMKGSVGSYGVARWTPLSIDKAERTDFIAGVEQLVNKETLDTLINLKAQGGTLGALSDQERIMLQNAASKIGFWKLTDDGKVYGYETSEENFKKELNEIKRLANKAITNAGGISGGGSDDDLLKQYGL